MYDKLMQFLYIFPLISKKNRSDNSKYIFCFKLNDYTVSQRHGIFFEMLEKVINLCGWL